jgi:hypothetical protein
MDSKSPSAKSEAKPRRIEPRTSGGLLLAIAPQYAEAFAGAAAGLDFGAVRIGSFDRSGRVCVAGPQA